MTTDMGIAAPHPTARVRRDPMAGLRRASRFVPLAAFAFAAFLTQPQPAAANDAHSSSDETAATETTAAKASAGQDTTAPGTRERTGTIDVRQQIECLAKTIYFEARGEPDAGKLAVGHVVMNRVASDDYPDTVCQVMEQGGAERLHRCQFSFFCDGRSDEPQDKAAWRHSQALARAVFWDFSPDPTGGARWYHADYVSPAWRNHFDKGPVIGQHVFYLAPDTRQPGSNGDLPQQLAERPGSEEVESGSEQ